MRTAMSRTVIEEKKSKVFSKPKWANLGGVALLACLGLSHTALAQDYGSIKKGDTPLTLSARGSFYVGGEVVKQTSPELGYLPPADTVTINQMYVDYMIQQGATKVPVIMVHGATLSGKTYDTTPDGRMGWFEYFVRQNHPTYVVDQVGRARSGFNQAVYNNVREGLVDPKTMPLIRRAGDNISGWQLFRFGPTPGTPYPDAQYPIEAAAEFSKQNVPDFTSAVPSPNPTFQNLADLAGKLGGAVVLGHSQSGKFPLDTFLVKGGERVKGAVMIEPGPSCGGGIESLGPGNNDPEIVKRYLGVPYNDEQIKKFASIPILIVYGDHIENNSGLPALPLIWQIGHDDCLRLIDRIKKAGGNATMVRPGALGMPGHSHMMMQDKGNLKIADIILAWIDKNVK